MKARFFVPFLQSVQSVFVVTKITMYCLMVQFAPFVTLIANLNSQKFTISLSENHTCAKNKEELFYSVLTILLLLSTMACWTNSRTNPTCNPLMLLT